MHLFHIISDNIVEKKMLHLNKVTWLHLTKHVFYFSCIKQFMNVKYVNYIKTIQISN